MKIFPTCFQQGGVQDPLKQPKAMPGMEGNVTGRNGLIYTIQSQEVKSIAIDHTAYTMMKWLQATGHVTIS